MEPSANKSRIHSVSEELSGGKSDNHRERARGNPRPADRTDSRWESVATVGAFPTVGFCPSKEPTVGKSRRSDTVPTRSGEPKPDPGAVRKDRQRC